MIGSAKPDGAACSVAIGNFDGVHRGHQAVVAAAAAAADARGLEKATLTFEPHPRAYFRPEAPAFRLTPKALKARRLAALGLDRLYVADFDQELAALTAEEFVRKVLVEALRARHVAVGDDFRFGRDRGGDVSSLRDLGRALGFSVDAIAQIGDGPAYSSSAVRDALTSAAPERAAEILGAWHRIEGVVETGDRRGRELGYPTANLPLDGVLAPSFGVYAVLTDILTGPRAGRHPGVASLGVRPQFGENIPNFETHIFDFDGDIYGETISVALVRFLRPEATFDSLEALIAQMDRDSAEARAALAAHGADWT